MGGNGRCTSSECLCLETASRGFHLALVMNILIIFTRLRAITVLRRATRLYLATRTVETIFSGCQWSEQKCPNLLRAGMPDDSWIYILSVFKEIDLRDLFIFAAFSIGNATPTTLDEHPLVS